MTAPSSDEARRILAGERYRPLWDAARARLERTGLSISNRPIRIEVSGEARVAIAGLVGRSPAGTVPLAVRLDQLDEALRRGAAAIGLVGLLEQIDGPLIDRRASRAQRNAVVSSSWEELARHPAIRLHSRLVGWLDGLRSTGSALRLAGSVDEVGPLVRRGLDVAARLPVDQIPLAVLAAEATGDAHALDRSTVLGSLVLGALGFVDVPTAAGDTGTSAPRPAASWREAWSRVGVVCDDVSMSVLVLNLGLTGRPAGPVSSAIIDHGRAGLPLRLTLQQLRSEDLRIAPGLVRSCENPTVVTRAAAGLGARSGPLLCTDGQPSSAVDELLRQVRACGASVAHHGDFDWGGIRIANTLISRHQVAPWRFSTPDYLEALDVGRLQLDRPRNPVSASWDPDLVPAMRTAGRRIFEEQVLPTLLGDLAP